jgi:hypothetical protein
MQHIIKYTEVKAPTKVGGYNNSNTLHASRKSNPSSIPRGIVNLYSALPWVTWESVTVVEGIP